MEAETAAAAVVAGGADCKVAVEQQATINKKGQQWQWLWWWWEQRQQWLHWRRCAAVCGGLRRRCMARHATVATAMCSAGNHRICGKKIASNDATGNPVQPPVADKIDHYFYHSKCHQCSSTSGVLCGKGFSGRRKGPQKGFWIVEIKTCKIIKSKTNLFIHKNAKKL